MYFIYILPGFILALIAQAWISISFKKYSQLPTGSNITGKQAAQLIKEGERFSVDIVVQGENLSDHFDPSKNIVSISKASLEDSVASVAVVAHEFGHVQQKYSNSFLFNLRTALVPIVNVGSRLGYILIIVGLILNILGLAEIGLILFALTTVFALVTLPIEIDASKKAFKLIKKYNLISESRIEGAKSILTAAATTYIAALLTSLLNVLYYASLVRKRS
ncbi:MAG: zinc metallopeptidase [Candidatus Dojkabacteria bacterium]